MRRFISLKARWELSNADIIQSSTLFTQASSNILDNTKMARMGDGDTSTIA
jgi:hypothetical protein